MAGLVKLGIPRRTGFDWYNVTRFEPPNQGGTTAEHDAVCWPYAAKLGRRTRMLVTGPVLHRQ